MFVQNLLSTEFSQEHFNPTAQGPRASLRGWRLGALVAAAKVPRDRPLGKYVRYVTGWWWLEHEWIMTFHSVGSIIIPTDFHSIIFQRGGEKSPTRSYPLRMQLVLFWWLCPNISPISWDMTGKIHGWVNPTSHWENAGWIGISSLVIPHGVAKPLVFTIPVSKHDGGIRKIVPSSR